MFLSFTRFLYFLLAATDGIHTVQSTLRFSGRDRRNGNQLMPIDSGLYACIFENAVKKAESTMNLRVERELKQTFDCNTLKCELTKLLCLMLVYCCLLMIISIDKITNGDEHFSSLLACYRRYLHT